jgi:hypothetical protein
MLVGECRKAVATFSSSVFFLGGCFLPVLTTVAIPVDLLITWNSGKCRCTALEECGKKMFEKHCGKRLS